MSAARSAAAMAGVVDENMLAHDFAKAAADAMTLRELVDAWDRYALPVQHIVSHETLALLRKTYATNQAVLSGA